MRRRLDLGSFDPTPIVRRYPDVLRPVDTIESLGNHGGRSGSWLWRYTSLAGRLVLRAWPEERRNATELARIQNWVRELADLRCVPVPYPALDDSTLIDAFGRFWELAPWLDGESAIDRPGSELVRTAYDHLARVHRRLEHDMERGPSPAVRTRLAELIWFQHEGFARVERALAARLSGGNGARVERWLLLARQAAPGVMERLRSVADDLVVLQPVLRDPRPEHFLFTGDRLTGLVDFGAMGIDCVAVDLARLTSEWFSRGDPQRATAFSAYARVRALTDREWRLIAILEDACSILVGAHWVLTEVRDESDRADPEVIEAGLRHGVELLETLVFPSPARG